MALFSNKNRLWWYGAFLVDVGLFLWIVSIVDSLTLPVLNLLSSTNLTAMSEVGRLAVLFSLGFGSASVIGWGFAIMGSSLVYTKEVRSYLVTGMLAWYIFDGVASALSGFYLNILSNTLFLISASYVMYSTDIK